MSTATAIPLIGHTRAKKAEVLEPATDAAATPDALRAIARELGCSRSKAAFAELVTQFDNHADHMESHKDSPYLEITKDMVTVTETAPMGSVLIVPAPACGGSTVGTHVAAALTAGNRVSLATFGPVDSITTLLHEVLSEILTSQLFTVLSPGTGWETPIRQSVVVVTPDGAFANDQPWWRHHTATNHLTNIGDLVRFYGRSSSIHMPYRTSPYRGFAS